MPRTPDDYLSEVLRQEATLRAILYRFAPQPADLQDLLQETFSRLFSLSAARRAEVQNIEAFAVTTARHVALDWLRRQRVVKLENLEDVSDTDLQDEAVDLEEVIYTHQQVVRIAAGIAQLSQKAREVFILRRVYDLSQREIAVRLGISEGAVEQQLIRGMKRCMELIQAEDAQRLARRLGLFERLRKRLRARGQA
jgi:RNA polymerase sigma-70 factor (ECF subfamily)